MFFVGKKLVAIFPYSVISANLLKVTSRAVIVAAVTHVRSAS